MQSTDLPFLRADQVAELRGFLALSVAEGEALDYKRDLGSDYHATVAAMANTSGGVLVVGVDEDKARKTPIDRGGFPSTDPRGTVTSHLWNHLDPVPSVRLATIDAGSGLWYVVIGVEASTDHVVLHREAGVCVRVGDQTRAPSRSDFNRLLAREATRSGRVLKLRREQRGVVESNAQPGAAHDRLTVFVLSQPIRPTELALDEVLDGAFEGAVRDLLIPGWTRVTKVDRTELHGDGDGERAFIVRDGEVYARYIAQREGWPVDPPWAVNATWLAADIVSCALLPFEVGRRVPSAKLVPAVVTAGIAAYQDKGLLFRPELAPMLVKPTPADLPHIARTLVVAEPADAVALAHYLVADLARVYQVRGADAWSIGLGAVAGHAIR